MKKKNLILVIATLVSINSFASGSAEGEYLNSNSKEVTVDGISEPMKLPFFADYDAIDWNVTKDEIYSIMQDQFLIQPSFDDSNKLIYYITEVFQVNEENLTKEYLLEFEYSFEFQENKIARIIYSYDDDKSKYPPDSRMTAKGKVGNAYISEILWEKLMLFRNLNSHHSFKNNEHSSDYKEHRYSWEEYRIYGYRKVDFGNIYFSSPYSFLIRLTSPDVEL